MNFLSLIRLCDRRWLNEYLAMCLLVLAHIIYIQRFDETKYLSAQDAFGQLDVLLLLLSTQLDK